MASKEGRPAARLTARGAATKGRIVAAAASIIRERGVAGTSLEAVMTATGTSRSQLYHYFANKDALIGEVIKTQLGLVIAAQEPLLSELSSWAGLQRWCDHLVDMVRETQGIGGCPLGSLVGEVADRSEVARLELVRSFAKWQSYLSRGFAIMRDNGELAAEADTDELALTVISALQGGLLMAQTLRGARPLELALDMALAYVGGFRRDPTPVHDRERAPAKRPKNGRRTR